VNYGNAIRVARAVRNLSQKDLAERVKLDSSYISLIEKGIRKPSLDTLESIARGLQIPMDLVMLLASDEQDLRVVRKDQATRLGMQLLEMIVNAAPLEPKQSEK